MAFIRVLIEIVCILVILAIVVGGGGWVLSKVLPKRDKSTKEKLQERKEELKDLAGMAKQADELKPLVKDEDKMKAKVEDVIKKEDKKDGPAN